MKANELRIGSYIWLKCHHLPVKVEGIFKETNGSIWVETDLHEGEKIEDFEPIPITEERLERFRFKEWDKGSKKFHNGTFEYFVYCDKVGKFHFYSHNEVSGHSFYITEIEYIHQLQNLYFALTGE